MNVRQTLALKFSKTCCSTSRRPTFRDCASPLLRFPRSASTATSTSSSGIRRFLAGRDRWRRHGQGHSRRVAGRRHQEPFPSSPERFDGGFQGRPAPRAQEIVMLAHAQLARHLIDLDSFVTLCYARLDVSRRNPGSGGLRAHRHPSRHGKTGACEMLAWRQPSVGSAGRRDLRSNLDSFRAWRLAVLLFRWDHRGAESRG